MKANLTRLSPNQMYSAVSLRDLSLAVAGGNQYSLLTLHMQ